MKILLVTNIPSPYQVQLFDEIVKSGQNLEVIYTRKSSPGRNWKYDSKLFQHKHKILKEYRIKGHWYVNLNLLHLIRTIRNSDVIIVCQYASFTMQLTMYISVLLNKRFVFWSEAVDGVKFEERKLVSNESLSLVLRKWALFPVKKWAYKLWGIGKKGVSSLRGINPNGEVFKFNYYSDLSSMLMIGEQKNFYQISKVKFLFCGSLIERKGIDLVINANFKLIENGIDEYEIVVVGNGNYLKKMEEAKFSNISLEGFVPPTELSKYFRECNVLLFPSRYDGWGLALIEGLASGLPVISTKEVGSAVELINPSNGVLLENIESQNLYESMVWFIRNKPEIERMSKAAKLTGVKGDVKWGVQEFSKLINNL